MKVWRGNLPEGKPCDRQVNLVIKNLLVEPEWLPRRLSVCSYSTVVPCLLFVFALLQDEVVQFDHICILFNESSTTIGCARASNTHLFSKLVGGAVYADDKVSTIFGMLAWWRTRAWPRWTVFSGNLAFRYPMTNMIRSTKEHKRETYNRFLQQSLYFLSSRKT